MGGINDSASRPRRERLARQLPSVVSGGAAVQLHEPKALFEVAGDVTSAMRRFARRSVSLCGSGDTVEQIMQCREVGAADVPTRLFRMAMEVDGADQGSTEPQRIELLRLATSRVFFVGRTGYLRRARGDEWNGLASQATDQELCMSSALHCTRRRADRSKIRNHRAAIGRRW